MVPIDALRGRPVFQIAFVVTDFDAALRRFENVLAPGPWRCFTFGSDTHEKVEYRGAPAEFSTLLALNGSDPQFELIQPLSGRGAHQEWLDAQGEGFHHLGVLVDSVETTVAQMTDAGYETIQIGSGIGPQRDGAYAYFDTTRDLGFVVEAVEPPTSMPEPDRIWP
jgi:catechol 2,3-dioxygenase-like lactoylglutathione lyase family enzyme